MKTKHELRLKFQDMHDLLIPAGTKATWVKGGSGGWMVNPSQVQLLSKTENLFKQDATYYYIWVPEKDLKPT